LVTLLLIFFSATPILAQPTSPFGSEGDLREQLQDQWWQRDKIVEVMGGLSLIGPQWRAAANIRMAMVTRPITFRLDGTLRAGPTGTYSRDTDELYDLLRLLSFARYNAPQTVPLYLRAGPLDGMRLGIGHVVNYYGTAVAWDERTIGAEFHYGGHKLSIGGFTGDVRLEGVTGGRVAARPLALATALPLRTVRFGFNYVTDLAPNTSLEAYSADLQFDLFTTGDMHFAPYVSYAWYPEFGDGLAFGADLYAVNFLDRVTASLRIGAFYNSQQFIPGYVGALYAVHNLRARTRRSSGDELAGVSLEKSRGASDLVTELHIEVPPGFSLRYYYRRHFGGQPLNEYHLRLFVRSGQRLRLEVGADKMGATGFLGIFGAFGDQSALVFGADYRIIGAFRLSVQAKYGFEMIEQEEGAARYLVQRRFEPLLGLRVQL